MLCKAEHRKPNLKLFSYMTVLLTPKFLKKLLGVHVYTHVPLLDPPLAEVVMHAIYEADLWCQTGMEG
jgi:hypothetical protein